MKLTEARVGIIALACAAVGNAVVMWADVRENTHAIARLTAHDAEQDAQRDEARQTIMQFLREYERKESEDGAVNREVEQLRSQLEALEHLVNDVRVDVARKHGAH